jgi:hypothetical protein
MFDDHALRMNLFSLYIFIEIGGTGGGCFRYMYARFLQEAHTITGLPVLADVADLVHTAGKTFTEIGELFKDAATMKPLPEAIDLAAQKFRDLAVIEDQAYTRLDEALT